MTYFELAQALSIFNLYEPSGKLEIIQWYDGNTILVGMEDQEIREGHRYTLGVLGWVVGDISPLNNRIHAYHWVYEGYKV